MNIKRTVVIGVAGGAVAVWIAGAATSNTRPIAPIVAVKPTAVDKSGAELAIEVKRLHERLRPGDAPLHSRDLFHYSSRASAGVASAAPAAPPSAAPAVQEPPPVLVQPLKLEGLAEDQAATGPVRTAIISGFGDIFLVKEGDNVSSRYQVVKISSEAVELIDLAANTTLRLALR